MGLTTTVTFTELSRAAGIDVEAEMAESRAARRADAVDLVNEWRAASDVVIDSATYLAVVDLVCGLLP